MNAQDETAPKWLFMVYMQAGDSSQLDSLAVQDLIEMEKGLWKKEGVEVLVEVQRKWPSERQRYRLRYDESLGDSDRPDKRPSLATLVQPQPVAKSNGKAIDMSSRVALAEFLNAGFALGAENNCLVLWGHAFGLGFGRFHDNPLTLGELRGALSDAGQKLDVLATNACTMSYIEAAYQLHDKVQFLVASQAFVPLTGLPYERILRGITSAMDPKALSQTIVDRYVEDFSDSRTAEGNARRGEKVAMTVLNLDNRREAGEKLDRLALAIMNVIGEGDATNFERLDEIRDVFLANPAGDVRPVLDLYTLTNDLVGLCDDWEDPTNAVLELRAAATALGEAVRPPSVVRSGGGVPLLTAAEGSIVVYHGEHPDLADMSGVGVFAPFVVDRDFLRQLELDDEPGRGKSEYKKLLIFNEGERINWVTLVYERLRLIDDDLDEIVDTSGVVRPAHRIQVNQLVRAVDAAFNKLDRVLRKSAEKIIEELKRRHEDKRRKAPFSTFGPPYLQLAGDLSLLNPVDLKNMGFDVPDTPGGSDHDRVVNELMKIERAVELIEKTTQRVITNRTFGLGPPRSPADGGQSPLHLGPKPIGGELGPKPIGGELGPKPIGGELGPKPIGGELGPKPIGGELGSETGAFLAYASSDPQIANLAVCTLIGLAASSLAQLERATGGVHGAAAQFLFRPGFGAMLSSNDYAAAVEKRCEEAFALLAEVALQARRTIRRVLAHPVYGLGPGPDGFGQAERDALATASGLSRRNLMLLSGSLGATVSGVRPRVASVEEAWSRTLGESLREDLEKTN